MVGVAVLGFGLVLVEGCGANGDKSDAANASGNAGSGGVGRDAQTSDSPTDDLGVAGGAGSGQVLLDGSVGGNDGSMPDSVSDIITETLGDARADAPEAGEAGTAVKDGSSDVDGGMPYCAAPDDYGSALSFDGSKALETISESTSNEVGLQWYPYFTAGSSRPMLELILHANRAPFGASLSPMTVDLATQIPDNCAACVRLLVPELWMSGTFAGMPNGNNQQYAATGGTLTVTMLPPVPPTSTSLFSGTLSNVTFDKFDPAADGCATKIDAASFSALIITSYTN